MFVAIVKQKATAINPMKLIFMQSNKRFKALCDRMGFEIVPIATMVDSKLTRRPDIEAVLYHESFVMVIPKKMYFNIGFDIGGRPMRTYWEAEHRLYQYKYGK